MNETKTNSELIEICTFYLRNQIYGVNIQNVREINKNQVYTKTPRAPEFVLGVMNLRGRIVTVIDLAVKLGLSPSRTTSETRILIVDSHNEYVGLLIDRIGDVVSAPGADIDPPPANLDDVAGAMTVGVYKSPGLLINILDIDRVVE